MCRDLRGFVCIDYAKSSLHDGSAANNTSRCHLRPYRNNLPQLPSRVTTILSLQGLIEEKLMTPKQKNVGHYRSVHRNRLAAEFDYVWCFEAASRAITGFPPLADYLCTASVYFDTENPEHYVLALDYSLLHCVDRCCASWQFQLSSCMMCQKLPLIDRMLMFVFVSCSSCFCRFGCAPLCACGTSCTPLWPPHASNLFNPPYGAATNSFDVVCFRVTTKHPPFSITDASVHVSNLCSGYILSLSLTLDMKAAMPSMCV